MTPWEWWMTAAGVILGIGLLLTRIISILLDIRDLLRQANVLNRSKRDPDDPAPAFEVRRGI